jgi:ribosome-binding factor A
VSSLASVVRVETTPDLKHCKVYISTLGSDEERQSTKEGLASSSGYIRKELAKRMNLRNTPELHFEMDDSIEYGIHMSSLIDKTIQHDEQENNNGTK